MTDSTSLPKVEDRLLLKIEYPQLLSTDKLLPNVESCVVTGMSDQLKYPDFAARLNELMSNPDAGVKNVTDLKNALGVTYEMARRYTLGIAKPRDKRLEAMAGLFGVEPSYLDHGTGVSAAGQSSMVALHNEAAAIPQMLGGGIRVADVVFGTANAPNPDHVKIPVHRHVKAACGNGNEVCLEDVSEYLDVDPRWLKLLGITTSPESLKIIFADEYSMWPTVIPETPLFIDVQDNDPSRLRNGKVYVFTHNYHLRMKRIFVNFDGSVKFTSDNPDKNEYPDEIITAEQAHSVNFVGRLVWFGSPA